MPAFDQPAWIRWLIAVSPDRWPQMVVPAILGQALGVASTGTLSSAAFAAGLGFTVASLVFLVLMSAWVDRHVDRMKQRLFPESLLVRTIPDGVLRERSALYAGLGAGATALGLAIAFQEFMSARHCGLAGMVCMLLFTGCILPPVRLRWSGAREIVELLAIGVALPWFNMYLQTRVLAPGALVLLVPFVVLTFAAIVAGGLTEETGDRVGGKRTLVAVWGPSRSRRVLENLLLTGMVMLAVMPVLVPGLLARWVVWCTLLVMLGVVRRLPEIGRGAVPFDRQAGYDGFHRRLQRCIWGGTLTFAVLLVLDVSWRAG